MNIIPSTKNEYLKRINQIYAVLKKNDFGYVIEKNTFLKKFPFMRNRKAEKAAEFADETLPVRVRKVLEELGPAYIKLGQMLSTRPDLVGWEMANELEKLRDDTPATPFSEIKPVIEEQLGKPINEVYTDFDETPIGSASIGQVYKAILIENNEEVAIKVQKPNIQKIIEADVKIMEFLANNMNKYVESTRIYNLPAIVYEFKRSIRKELNYKEEVMNMEHLAYNFRTNPYIYIPKAYTDYCNTRLITMEFIKGAEMEKVFESTDPKYNKKLIATRGVKAYFKQIFIDGFFHADPHPGNLMVMENNVVCFIDEGMMGILDDNFKENLAELIILLISGNTDHLLNQLNYMGIINNSQKEDPKLKDDVNDLMSKYYGADLKNMEGGLKDLLDAMIKNNVVLPREFVMIGRGVALIEETGQKLDPEFDTIAQLKKLSKKILLNKYNPKRIAKNSENYLLEIEHLAKNLPTRIDNLIYKLEDGEISITLKHAELEKLTHQLSVSIILAALLVGSSLTIVSKTGPKLFDMSVFGLVGFSFSGILAGYLLIRYIKDSEK
ncbi:MAG: AarF/ABC1/UbiB kinase family protein [Methanobrevibacter sp.]|uniref:ABC1 kinase family protein n=1 Tax=Methanobrevibacter sp. TaxID=66852 RepID=UPI0026DFED97|nr:AarF/ABC1/UbiB kinase family protein [Methanobrevibacter sp.]MDO5848980.1 AarF/ABC1/UbiB kinase family protein [Methanobrevibacter sp.]